MNVIDKEGIEYRVWIVPTQFLPCAILGTPGTFVETPLSELKD